MHQHLTQAKGARWMLMFMIGIGGFVTAKIVPIIQYLLGRYLVYLTVILFWKQNNM
ncbi:hypothetical protein ACLBWZ_17210 [Brucellaceae bacterium C25G]